MAKKTFAVTLTIAVEADDGEPDESTSELVRIEQEDSSLSLSLSPWAGLPHDR